MYSFTYYFIDLYFIEVLEFTERSFEGISLNCFILWWYKLSSSWTIHLTVVSVVDEDDEDDGGVVKIQEIQWNWNSFPQSV